MVGKDSNILNRGSMADIPIHEAVLLVLDLRAIKHAETFHVTENGKCNSTVCMVGKDSNILNSMADIPIHEAVLLVLDLPFISASSVSQTSKPRFPENMY